jgi:hypothetical protein
VATSVSERLDVPKDDVRAHIERVIVSSNKISVMLPSGRGKAKLIEILWKPKAKGEALVQLATSASKPDQKLLKSIVRAHAWLSDLTAGRHQTIESLATAVNVHPKVVRQEIRLAFLAPDVTASALKDEPLLSLKQIPKNLPLPWHQHGQ